MKRRGLAHHFEDLLLAINEGDRDSILRIRGELLREKEASPLRSLALAKSAIALGMAAESRAHTIEAHLQAMREGLEQATRPRAEIARHKLKSRSRSEIDEELARKLLDVIQSLLATLLSYPSVEGGRYGGISLGQTPSYLFEGIRSLSCALFEYERVCPSVEPLLDLRDMARLVLRHRELPLAYFESALIAKYALLNAESKTEKSQILGWLRKNLRMAGFEQTLVESVFEDW
jgi:hypothetical protein